MITFLIILGSILIVLGWLFFSPMVFNIDTERKQYYVRIRALFKLQYIGLGSQRRIRVVVAFIPFSINLSDRRTEKSNKGHVKHKKLTGIHRLLDRSLFEKLPEKLDLMYKYGLRVVHSFRIKKIMVDFDTGDVVLNAQLVPVLLWLSQGRCEFTVNYNDNNRLLIVLTNRLYRILWYIGIMYFKLKKSKKA